LLFIWICIDDNLEVFRVVERCHSGEKLLALGFIGRESDKMKVVV